MEPQELLHFVVVVFVVVLAVEHMVCLKNYHVGMVLEMVLEKFVVVRLNCLTI